MEEERKQILNESNHAIGRLQLMSAFFEAEIVYKIYLRTQVIHRLFESNPELDIHRLDLFHLQFTEPVMELLKKVKKKNEKSVVLIFEEMELNKGLISRLETELFEEQQYERERAAQVQKIGSSISNLYQNLADLSTDVPFPKDITRFSETYAREYFAEIPATLLENLIHFNPDEVYQNAYGIIHKKLMGLQCKHRFGNQWLGGLRCRRQTLELYKMSDLDKFFLYYPERNLFLFLDTALLEGVELTEPLSKKAKFIQELIAKNEALELSIDDKKKHLPAEVQKLLEEYLAKIADIDFLEMNNFDVQANILKTMLNTDGL
jgi:hypothetical protein